MRKLKTLTEEKNAYDEFVTALLESKYFNDEENLGLQWICESKNSKNFILGLQPINEDSFKDWLTKKSTQAKEFVKDGVDKAKDKAVQFLAKVGDQLSKYIKILLDHLKDFLKKAWNYISKEVPSQLAGEKDQFVEKLKNASVDKAEFTKEIKQLKDMTKGALDWVTGGVVKDMETSMVKAGSENTSESLTLPAIIALTECIKEDKSILFEIFESKTDETKIPGLSKLAHKLAHYPPFSWLHSIEGAVKEKTNSYLQKMSIFLSDKAKVSGPYEFDVIGDIVKLWAGSTVKHGVKEIAGSIAATGVGVAVATVIPGIGLLLNIMYYLAKAIFIVQTAESVINSITT